jgi:hypothetical protein
MPLFGGKMIPPTLQMPHQSEISSPQNDVLVHAMP